jgi:hypothetical protein
MPPQLGGRGAGAAWREVRRDVDLHELYLSVVQFPRAQRAGAVLRPDRQHRTVDDPTGRACVGFRLVRGGVHIVAYAKALEKLTGVDVGKLLPIPDISTKRFPEAAKHEARGLHRILYQFSPEDYPWGRRDLERDPSGGRQQAVGGSRRSRGRRAAGSRCRAAADRADRTRHRSRDVRGRGQAAVPGDESEAEEGAGPGRPLGRVERIVALRGRVRVPTGAVGPRAHGMSV